MEDVPGQAPGPAWEARAGGSGKAGMDPSHLTQKSQEALHDAQTKALRFGHSEVDGEHLLLALLDQPEGIAPRLLSQAGADPDRLRKALEAELSRRPRVTGPGVQPGQVGITQRLARLLDTAQQEADRLKDEYVSVEHLLLALISEGPTTAAGRLLHDEGVTTDRFLEALTKIRGNQRVTSAMPESAYEALVKYGTRSGGRGGQRAARPGDWPRRRDQAGHPDPVAKDQEQPGADRRPRRGQDGHRGGPGPADQPRRRTRGTAGQDDLQPGHGVPGGRGQVPRRVRGAASGRPERGQRGGGPDPAVRRRAAQRGGRGRRRGGHGRGQHAQAHAGPRRAAHDRRHHPGRIPSAHREGRRPGTPVPASHGGRAVR